MNIETISSAQNPRIKHLLALQQKSSLRREEGLFVVEGRREMEHCINAGMKVECIYCLDDNELSNLSTFNSQFSILNSQLSLVKVTKNVYERIAYRGSTEGIIAVIRTPQPRTLASLLQQEGRGVNGKPLFVVLERVEKPGLIYFVADVYIRDLKYLGTAFATGEGNGEFNVGTEVQIDKIAKRVNAIVAINGDHYKLHNGTVIRNGVLYSETPYEDVCVLYTDGSMETFTKDELDIEAVKAAGPWQVWSFGPGLLDAEGHAKTFFDGQSNVLNVNVKNPRCAIGYYEPGHYCLVKVEGNRWGKFIGSYGMTFSEMASMFEELGCVRAYALDGGRSAAMSWLGEFLSTNYDRGSFDIVYISDTPVVADTPKAAEMPAESEG